MRWSALKKRLVLLFDPGLDVDIHLTGLEKAKSQGAFTHLGLLRIRVDGAVVWDFPHQFKVSLADHPGCTLATLMGVLHAYLDLPKNELLTSTVPDDPFDLRLALACMDRRIGKKKLLALADRPDTPDFVRRILALRFP